MIIERHAKTIEALANIGIIIVAALGAALLVKQLLVRDAAQPQSSARPSASAPRAPTAGSRISLPGVTWSTRERTLVLVLSTTCRFCTNSAPFYQRLVSESQRSGKVRLIAVLPQPVAEGARYLTDLGVGIRDVVQASLGSVNTRGTPTLILVDESGTVTRTWTGQLPRERESEVFDYF